MIPLISESEREKGPLAGDLRSLRREVLGDEVLNHSYLGLEPWMEGGVQTHLFCLRIVIVFLTPGGLGDELLLAGVWPTHQGLC